MGALARSYRLPAGLLEGIAIVESSVNPAAISRNGSLDPRRWDYGLMQVNGTTGLTIASRRGLGNFGLTSLLDPELSVSFAAWLLADNRQVSGDADLESMASAYNWGLRSGRTVRPIPNPEYTSRVVALANASAEGAF